MIKEITSKIVFIVSTYLYMCNAVESGNYKSLRKRR